MNPRRLFIASCISLITSAFTFVVRGDVLQDMGNAFGMSQADKGSLEGAVFLGMAASMLIGGFICDVLGMKRIMLLAFWCHLIGVLATVAAKYLFGPAGGLAFPWLFSASFLMGCGNGMVETGINPLAATLYPTKKTHVLNLLHAWWPGGLVLGGLLAQYVGKGIDLGVFYIEGLHLPWYQSIAMIIVPCLIYGALLIGQKFPVTERVAAGVSMGDMIKEAFRLSFLVWAFCMLLTAATELGPQKWQESVMRHTAHVSGTMILVYTSGMMFVLRHFAGPLAHAVSPVGMLTVSALLSAIGLYLLSTAESAATAFTYATIFGLGIAYFWPTMLGVTAERFPRGGALLLCLMGCVGNLSISQVLPQMGRIYDHYSVESLKESDTKTHGRLGERLVNKDGSINQDRAKKFDLLATLSPGEKAAINLKTWNTKAGATEAGLPLEQSLLRQALKAGEVSLADLKAGKAPLADPDPPALEDDKSAAALDIYGDTRRLHLTLYTWQELDAAQLTPTQKTQLADDMRGKGEGAAGDKIVKDDFKVDELTTKQRTLLEAAVGHLSLSPVQEKVLEEKNAIEEAEKAGAAMAFRWVTILPAVLVVIFGLIALMDWRRGGYKAVHIGDGTAKENGDGLSGPQAHGGIQQDITGVRRDG